MAEEAIYVGLMSGTSLDGISASVVRFREADKRIEHDLLGFTHIPYDARQRDRLVRAMDRGTAAEYCALSFEVGAWLAEAASAAMAGAGVDAHEVRAVGSHGQTLWHIPRKSTWQIGETAVIAELTGVPVVSDFRVRDVAAGGEGAPLVPIADAMLYSHATEARLLQNIGGIANVSIVQPGGDPETLVAFDTGPGVAVIDNVVRALFADMRYDAGGAIAASGIACTPVVDALLEDGYFAARPPKSTGREHFGDEYSRDLARLCRGAGCTPNDIVATAVSLTVRSIARAYGDFVRVPGDVVVSGGGSLNTTLMNGLRDAIKPRSVLRFDEVFYDPEAKEAVAFALLAHLHLGGLTGNVTGATGARGPRVLGKLTPA